MRGTPPDPQTAGALRNRKPTVSYHEHNESERSAELVERLVRGESWRWFPMPVCRWFLDPGYRLVRAAVEQGIPVQPVPGPSALLAALSASGLPTDAFHFGGFLPPKPGQRKRVLENLRDQAATLVFYEAPHRVLEALAAVEEVLGPRPVVLARELTKLHEEFLRGTPDQLRRELESRDSIKGEITLLVGKALGPPPDDTPVEEAVAGCMRDGMQRMDAIKAVARRRGLSKREVYARLEKSK